MADVPTEIFIGAAGSLVASGVTWILGAVSKNGAEATPVPAHIGVQGNVVGPVSVQQTTNVHNVDVRTIINNAPRQDGESDTDELIVLAVVGFITAILIGSVTALFWRQVTLFCIPFAAGLSLLTAGLVVWSRQGLRSRHCTTLVFGALTVAAATAPLRILTGLDDITRALRRADGLSAKGSVITHLSPDKSVQLGAAAVAMVGLILLVLTFTLLVLSAAVANSRPATSPPGRLHVFVSLYERRAATTTVSVVSLVLVVIGLWVVSEGLPAGLANAL